nr:hypothetical protein GCM10020093_091500 [Planobispora longispora]
MDPPPDSDAPEPWGAHDGGQVWRLPAHEGRMLDEHALADAPAPYPDWSRSVPPRTAGCWSTWRRRTG